MRPAEKIEEIVSKANCEAPDAMRRRLWKDVADQLHQSQATMQGRSSAGVWRILMNSRMARSAVAAVVVVAALAVGVERLTRSKPNKVQAFSAKIQANMALDLDPEAALPLREAQPEDFDVTWSSEHGGSLQILPGSSLRILACPFIDPQWDGAISWSYSNLAKLKESTATRVVPTKREPFVAVLTSEGNLAVIKIGGRKETHAWLSWQVERPVSPVYSEVQTLTVRIVDPQGDGAEDGAVDLDTGQILSIPADVLTLPTAEMLTWLEQNGIDAIARKTEEGYGLTGVGLVFWTWSPGSWAGDDALEVRQDMASASFQPRRPLLYQEGQYQYAFPFKTREGGIGMLQMLAVNAAEQTVQFRYKMVQEGDGETPEASAEVDAESQRLAESVDRLMRFGRSLLVYANDHNDELPQTFQDMKDYADSKQDYQWIVENTEYLGVGITTADSPLLMLAYDRTLLEKGKGTYVLFLDCHAEFIEPERLPQYGLSPEP